ncbi:MULTISPECIES: hypothetical protein [unclassified Luteimonas]|uniref:hypothetical protein n=1 Tax=unclassified Luteimonas TaxID=2629088 RepID=UPI0018F09511|nr:MULTISPECIES: hypothetical protein [unclassified Luteimonas]MBJ6979759.1 hypothetical protein [Luteimonas sp. MC1895]MBJ6985550.1 hypothetical protein [Luteimonas sp. MC1750]QQO05966.1 hypothetical protein JGR68_00430 [Luteimonas sp. MC1750]
MNPDDMMRLLQAAAVLFTLAALGGLVMACIRFMGRHNPPAWIAMLHGLLAAAGITLLAYGWYAYGIPAAALLALLLFLLAAAGGAVLSLAYKWKQRLLPAGLVIGHAVAAVAAYVLLLLAVLGDGGALAGG